MNAQQHMLEMDIQDDVSFSEVHKLINEEKKKCEDFNDAGLEKSISSLVDFKF